MPKVKTNKITTSRSSSDKRKTKKSPSKPKSLDKTKLAKKDPPKSKTAAQKTKNSALKVKKTAPKVKKTAPKAKKATPKANKAAPKTKKATPKAKKATPKVKKAAPKVKKATPKEKKATPKVKKATPKVKKAAPKSKPVPQQAKNTAPEVKKRGRPRKKHLAESALSKHQKDSVKKNISKKSTEEVNKNRIALSSTKTQRFINQRQPEQVIPKVLDYEIGEYVVYPSHGVGKVTAIEDQIIGDLKLKMFVVVFDKEKMKLRVPVDKTSGSGMRRLSSPSKMDQAISTLKGKARQRRVMWSRRAQEYEAKLHSGDPIAIAEVIRDLFRNDEQPEQSYSERQMYEAALERLAREYAALENTDTVDATERLEEVLKTA